MCRTTLGCEGPLRPKDLHCKGSKRSVGTEWESGEIAQCALANNMLPNEEKDREVVEDLQDEKRNSPRDQSAKPSQDDSQQHPNTNADAKCQGTVRKQCHSIKATVMTPG